MSLSAQIDSYVEPDGRSGTPSPSGFAKGHNKVNVSLSPKGRYTRHNGPDGANLSFADYPP